MSQPGLWIRWAGDPRATPLLGWLVAGDTKRFAQKRKWQLVKPCWTSLSLISKLLFPRALVSADPSSSPLFTSLPVQFLPRNLPTLQALFDARTVEGSLRLVTINPARFPSAQCVIFYSSTSCLVADVGKPGGEVHSGLAFLLGRCHGRTKQQGRLGYLQKGAQMMSHTIREAHGGKRR